MKKESIVKAWKNAEFRESLSAEELSLLPGHPCGLVDLQDEDLAEIAGGTHLSCNTCNSCDCTHVGSCYTVYINGNCCV